MICYECRKPGHYANACPSEEMVTIPRWQYELFTKWAEEQRKKEEEEKKEEEMERFMKMQVKFMEKWAAARGIENPPKEKEIREEMRAEPRAEPRAEKKKVKKEKEEDEEEKKELKRKSSKSEEKKPAKRKSAEVKKEEVEIFDCEEPTTESSITSPKIQAFIDFRRKCNKNMSLKNARSMVEEFLAKKEVNKAPEKKALLSDILVYFGVEVNEKEKVGDMMDKLAEFVKDKKELDDF